MASEPTVSDRMILVCNLYTHHTVKAFYSELIRLPRCYLAGGIERHTNANRLFDQILDIRCIDPDSRTHCSRQRNTFQIGSLAGSRLET